MLIDVPVKIDDTRVNDLYALIIKHRLTSPRVQPDPESAGRESAWTKSDVDVAAAIWRQMSDVARRIMSVLLDAPGTRYAAADIAAIAQVPSGRPFAAALTWPGKFCKGNGRTQFWRYESGQYWIEPDVGAIFAKARSSAERG